MARHWETSPDRRSRARSVGLRLGTALLLRLTSLRVDLIELGGGLRGGDLMVNGVDCVLYAIQALGMPLQEEDHVQDQPPCVLRTDGLDQRVCLAMNGWAFLFWG